MSFYEDVRKFIDLQVFLKVFALIDKSGIWPESNRDEKLKAVAHMHEMGWLYYWQEEGKIVTVIGAYRIKKFDDSKPDVLEEEKEGKILYSPLFVSKSNDTNVALKMLRAYLDINKDIKEVIFYERNTKKVKKYKIKIKGEENEQLKSSLATASA